MRGFLSLAALFLALVVTHSYATIFLVDPEKVAKGITEKGCVCYTVPPALTRLLIKSLL